MIIVVFTIKSDLVCVTFNLVCPLYLFFVPVCSFVLFEEYRTAIIVCTVNDAVKITGETVLEHFLFMVSVDFCSCTFSQQAKLTLSRNYIE